LPSTIVLASWDAEEWGLLGSTEWGEKHAEELRRKAVAYINSDSNSKGVLRASGSHSLERLLNDVARDLTDPETGKSLFEVSRAQRVARAATEEDKKKIADRPDERIGPPGAGSDYVVFQHHLGVATLNIGFSGSLDPGTGGSGVYHSIYDTFDWYSRFADPSFVYGRALAQVAGTLLVRLADARVLPFEFMNLAETLERYVEELEKLKREDVDLAPLRPAVAELKKAAEKLEAGRKNAKSLSAARASEVNAALYRVERAMLKAEGLPGRDWYRHQFYAPGFYTGYDAKTLPGIREAIEEKQWGEARRQVEIVKQTMEAVTREIARSADLAK
jgi:N-acetylated-alpha-linked acidic dipeptidase